MDPIRKVVSVARHERAKSTVRVGQQVFTTVRNVAAIGAAAASILTGGFLATRDRTADPATQSAAPSAVPLITQLKGRLAFDVSFPSDLGTARPLPSGAQPSAQLKSRPDGVDIMGPGGFVPLLLPRAIPAKYLAEMELAAQPATQGTFTYTMRSVGPQAYQVVLDLGSELIRMQHVDSSVQPTRVTQLVANAIPATGILKGQSLQLAIAVDGSRYRVFTGGELAADVTDARISVADTNTTNLNIGASVPRGQFSVNALRIYALNDAAVTIDPLAQLRGALAYEPVIPRDLATPPPLASGARPTANVAPRGDVIDLVAPGEYAPIRFNRSIPTRYLAELELATRAGTEGQFNWSLRASGTMGVDLIIDPVNELLRLQLRDMTVTPARITSLIPSAVAIPGVTKGRVLRLAVAVDGTRFRAFLDGALIGDVVEPKVPVPPGTAQTGLIIGGNATKGGFSVSKIKVYTLNDAPAGSPKP
ncbi:MAG: hypothetical protein HY071_04050 [Chloroflexi bacterium]|nr:hypothetical protein [Chloroflexota bacterium]